MALNSILSQLENEQLIRAASDEDRTYIFKNALSQQAAYQSLLSRNRRELHRCVAEMYEKLYAENLDGAAALLAEHYSAAGDDAKTFEYSSRAGHAAMRVFASAEAIAHFTRALQVGQRLEPAALRGAGHDQPPLTDCYLHLGRALEIRGQFEKALQNYEEMESIALARKDSAMQLAALVALATIHSTATASSDFDHARTLSNLALQLAREIGDRKVEAKVLWNLMLLSSSLAEMQQSVEYGEQSLAISRELGMPEQTALTLNDLTRPYLSEGKYEQASAVLAESLNYFRETNNLPMICDNLCRTAILYMGRGELGRMAETAQEAEKISESIGNLWGQSFSRMFLGRIFFEQGEVSRALTTMRDSIRFAEESGFLVPMVQTRSDLAMVYGFLGEIDRGIELADQARAFGVERLPAFVAKAYSVLAQLYAMKGELENAEANLKEGYARMSEDFALRVVDQLPVAEVQIALAKKDVARAIKMADQASEQQVRSGLKFFRAELLFLKGQAVHDSGDEQTAHQIFSDAKQEAQRTGSRWMLWQIYVALGERDHARPMIDSIMQDMTDELRASFSKLPMVQQVLG